MRLRWFAPLAPIAQMSRAPVRSLTKAICVPSGDHVGSESSPGAVVRRVIPVASEFMT